MSAYSVAVERYVNILRAALELAEDPYKPPEATVEASKNVVAAAWEAQVQYAALLRKGGS